MFPLIEFVTKGVKKEINISDLVKMFKNTMEFIPEFDGKRWVKYRNGVIEFDIDEDDKKIKAGEYKIHVTMKGMGDKKTKTLFLQVIDPPDLNKNT